MKENIEYHKGWQIEKNGSPGSLHNKFSNDKIVHGIDSSLNLGMAEANTMEKEFEQIYESRFFILKRMILFLTFFNLALKKSGPKSSNKCLSSG